MYGSFSLSVCVSVCSEGFSKTCLVPDNRGHMHVHMFWFFDVMVDQVQVQCSIVRRGKKINKKVNQQHSAFPNAFLSICLLFILK